jgi:hypothetical protein
LNFSNRKYEASCSHLNDVEILDKRAYEWAFGRNKDGELSVGVSKNNALVPAQTMGLKELATR